MSGFIEEQEEEIEVLQSIFPTEFEQLETRNKFKIHISPGGDEIHGKSRTSSSISGHKFSSYRLYDFVVIFSRGGFDH